MSTHLINPISENRSATRLIMAMVLLAAVALTAGVVVVRSQAARPSPPTDFTLVAEIDLSAGPYEDETVGEFSLAETAVASLYLSLPNIDTPAFDLRLIGPDGESYPILQGDFITDRSGSGTWQQSLTPDKYKLVLSAAQSTGSAAIFWGMR